MTPLSRQATKSSMAAPKAFFMTDMSKALLENVKTRRQIGADAPGKRVGKR
jgi:hypothetical protein